MWEESIFLKHRIDAPLVGRHTGDILALEEHLALVGVFKPDQRIYLDALNKCGVPAGETVFIDDGVRNLDGAAALGITPILIAANPDSDVKTDYLKIRDLRELIR